MVRLLHVDLRLPMLSYTVRSPGADSALCGGPIFHLSCREHLHHHESVLLLRFHSSGCRDVWHLGHVMWHVNVERLTCTITHALSQQQRPRNSPIGHETMKRFFACFLACFWRKKEMQFDAVVLVLLRVGMIGNKDIAK